MVTRLIQHLIEKSKKSILLLGPRQTGKTTLLKGLKPDLTINLAKQSEYLEFLSDPVRLESVIEADKPKLILLDEVQRIPSLLNTVQYLIDEDRNLKFLLSGSSARKLKRGQANLLPGRIISYDLSGLSCSELGGKLDIQRALRLGFLPEPYLDEDDAAMKKLLTTYSATYLKEEIQAEALARNLEGFARFLVKAGQISGQIIDYSKISTQAKVSRTSTVRFVEILEDTLIASQIQVFSGAPSADIISHPKLYFFDVGVLNGLLQNFEVTHDRIGYLFEHLVYSQIRNSLIARDLPVKIYYFRTRHGVEVDFIVEIAGNVWAIEVKTGDVSPSDLKPLLAFREYFPTVHRCVVVSMKTRPRVSQDILICELERLLEEMGLV